MVLDCSVPCHPIVKILNSCPNKPINLSNPSSGDIHEIIMVFLSMSPYFISFGTLLVTTYFRTTRSIFILMMVFLQNFLTEVMKNNLKDLNPNHKCSQQYANPSNHASFLTSLLLWFFMDEINTPKKYEFKSKKYAFIFIFFYPFIIYSRVYLYYHSWEQIINGALLGGFVGVGWYFAATKLILPNENPIRRILVNFNIVNTMSDVLIGYGVSKGDYELSMAIKELIKKNEQLTKLKKDLRNLTKNINAMDFIKNGQNNLQEMLKGSGMNVEDLKKEELNEEIIPEENNEEGEEGEEVEEPEEEVEDEKVSE